MSSLRVRILAIAALERSGLVTADRTVEAARDKKHPLHNDFEWDDRKAAHQSRLDKAREIIASVRLVVKTETQRITSIAYVRDPRAPPHAQGYVSTAVLRDDVSYAREALDAEISGVESRLRRARELAITVGLEDELEAALRAIMVLHSRSALPPPKKRGGAAQLSA